MDGAVAALSILDRSVMITIMSAVGEAVIFALYLPIFTLDLAVRGGLG